MIRQRNGPPQLPKTTILNNRIVDIAKKKGGVIAGSFALKAFNPNYDRTVSDIDIIAKNPSKFAISVMNELNKLYGKKRFRVVKGVNAYRIHDEQNMRYVADIVNYPIRQNQYAQVQGVRVAQPEFVFEGKRKKARTSLGMGLGRMPDIRRFI